MQEQLSVTDFYTEFVLPALSERLDQAFPEFGWRRDARGWIATNEAFTHRMFKARAERVVARRGHSGFLVHGGDSMPWTAYLNGGVLPRGREFVHTVRELAARAGVDTTPIDRQQPHDRRADLLDDFFALCGSELRGEQGSQAQAYLEKRGLPDRAIDGSDLGVVPPERITRRALRTAGYSEVEITRSGVLSDGRWPGRLCGAWRDEHARIRTLWARTLNDTDTSGRFLYLRGASRLGLPPYGLNDVLRLPLSERRELLLVEGLIDVHHLRTRGLASVAAVGGARIHPDTLARLTRHGIETVTLAFDNDQPGRDGLARAVDRVSQAGEAPVLRVLDPGELGDAKDPDEYVRKHGVDAFRSILDHAECAISWRALDHTRSVSPDSDAHERRSALSRAGQWLGTLPARLALEQEDAISAVSERCGYSPEAVERAFRARFWPTEPKRQDREPAMRRARELDRAIDL